MQPTDVPARTRGEERMGAQLVRRAFAFAAQNRLTGNEFRVLAHMTLTALDGDAEPRYWAKREVLAHALGHLIPDAPMPGDPNEPETNAARERAFYAVKTAVRGLVNAGAIERLRLGRIGQTAAYRITLTGSPVVEKTPAITGLSPPQIGGKSTPELVEIPPPEEP